MPAFTTAALRPHCEHRLQYLIPAEQLAALPFSRAVLIQRITGIVSHNGQSGRAQRVIAATGPVTPHQLDGYIDRVIATFLREAPRLDRLSAADETEWAQLFKQLTQRAQSMLSRVDASPATAPEAIEFAQAACEAIFRTTFPFDVSFDAWATLILRNIIRQRYERSRDLLDRNSEVESLERPPHTETENSLALHELLADPNANVFEQREVRDWLLNALDLLPSVIQERVLIDLYFNDRSIPEVAQRLGRSVQAVYNLKHRALRELKHILTRERMDGQFALDPVESLQEPRHDAD